MIDIKLLQKDFEFCKNSLQKRAVDEKLLAKLQKYSLQLKTKRQTVEDIQATQNRLSSLFGEYKRENKDTQELTVKINKLKKEKIALEYELKTGEENLNNILYEIPNFPDDIVPQGVDENDNIVIEQIGSKPSFDFEPKAHWDIGNITQELDFVRGVKLSKSRFVATTGTIAKLERALMNYFLDFNTDAGFKEWSVPLMANKRALFGTGQLPKFEDDLFKVEGEDLYLIPTAEVSLTNLFNDEIISKDKLPMLLTSCTACFRKEAGSAGLDTRGMIRLHQFNKVEMVAITTQETSDDIFDKMVKNSCDILDSLKLPYQKVQLCCGDLGFSASRTIDLEVWLPGQKRYTEISSISNTKDFQARRAKIRYKDGKKNQLVHTLNGSALPIGRTVVAIMENYQNKDGTINIPQVLQKYL
ncbi:MAG: serine--tRNA ligase [Campylobacteraceae bacterium 4484_166]|nr:MAG: serine--tRNA ligase [Campylobacteraceae bacterium 4484_166]